MTRRAYVQRRRAEARRNGLCPGCCKRRPRAGFAKCTTCLASNRKTHARRARRRLQPSQRRSRTYVAISPTAMRTADPAVRRVQLANELFVLADVLTGTETSGVSGFDRQQRRAAKRQRIHVALLEQNGLIDADGKPPGWTVEQDRAEELRALSELRASFKALPVGDA